MTVINRRAAYLGSLMSLIHDRDQFSMQHTNQQIMISVQHINTINKSKEEETIIHPAEDIFGIILIIRLAFLIISPKNLSLDAKLHLL